MSYPHDTTTLDETACERCRAIMARDEYPHARVDNFYRRGHLRAVLEDRQAARDLRIGAGRALTHPSYPYETRQSAAAAVVRLTEPRIATLAREYWQGD